MDTNEQPKRRSGRRLDAEGAAALLARWRASGLTASAFCERERMSTKTLQRWRRRLAEGRDGARGFVKVTPPKPQTSAVRKRAEIAIQPGGLICVRVAMDDLTDALRAAQEASAC